MPWENNDNVCTVNNGVTACGVIMRNIRCDQELVNLLVTMKFTKVKGSKVHFCNSIKHNWDTQKCF
jgi:hypothetical protein